MKRLMAVGAVASAIAMTTGVARAFDGKTIAFYAFKDGEPGTSAVGVPIKNHVSDTEFGGSVVRTGAGEAFFSSERPGRYLFTNLTYGAECVFENPGSLYFPKTTTTSDYASLFIEGIVRELNQAVVDGGSANDAWKIEFFYKLEENQVIDKNKSDAETTMLRLKGACDLYSSAMACSYTNCDASVRFYDNNAAWHKNIYLDGYSTATGEWKARAANSIDISTTDDKAKNGRWHYISISSGYNNYSFAGRPEWRPVGNNFRLASMIANATRVTYRVVDPDGAFPLIVNPTGGFRGWISCLRITKAGIASGNLYASELPTDVPRTISHVRFEEGASGEALPSTLVNQEKLADVNTNITYYSGTAGQDGGTAYGDATVVTADGAGGAYADDVRRGLLLDGAAAGLDAAVSNRLSALLTPEVPAADDALTTGVDIRFDPEKRMRLGGSSAFTVEFFAKFDYGTWKARVGDVSPDSPRSVHLFWISYIGAEESTGTSYPYNTSLKLTFTDPGDPKLVVSGWGDSPVSAPQVLNGKWHHYALAISPVPSQGTAHLIAYLDYKKVFDQEVSYYGGDGSYAAKRYFHFGRGVHGGRSYGYSHGLLGCLDEIRVSNGVLGAEDFLRQKSGNGLCVLFQ